MKRNRPARSTRSSPALENLLQVANALGDSSSRLEDTFWESRLSQQIDKLLQAGEDELLNGALDQLYQRGDRGYEALADILESRTESHTTPDGDDLLLIALPILAWSRYAIPSGPVTPALLDTVKVQLKAHVLAADVRLGLADFLFSPEQLPPGFSDTARFCGTLGRQAQQDHDLHIDAGQMPEAMSFLSDTRYLLAVVATRQGGPFFRWQETDGKRETAQSCWQTQGCEALRPLFPGCALDAQLPLAFFSACREADRAARPYALKASVDFLNTVLTPKVGSLQATVAPFQDERRLVEYRIGFSLDDTTKVVHGVVWPLLDNEDENTDITAQISTTLKQAGLSQINLLDQTFPTEYCDDCGAPFYPTPEGDPVHAEMPEDDSPNVSRHLH
jgi:hypothetical protein